MSKNNDNNARDLTMTQIGFRLPQYLIDFVESYENEELKRTKSEVFRMFLTILYEQPWIIDDYLKNNQVTKTRYEAITKQLKTQELKIGSMEKTIEQMNNEFSLFSIVFEKIFNLTLNQIKEAPDHILERIYDEYKQQTPLK